MADIKNSDLTEITSLEPEDYVAVSQDNGGGGYDSRRISMSNFDMVSGLRIYSSSSTDPTLITPNAGDMYFNTTLGLRMIYDGARSKWLSQDTISFTFARAGNTSAGAYFRFGDGLAFSATNGFYFPLAGTVTGLTYTRDDSDSATLEITADGTTVASLATAATSGSSLTLDGDFSAGVVLGARNSAASANTVSTVAGWATFRARVA
jgi:hypothetical protein